MENIAPSEINYTIQVNLTAPLIISSLFIKLSKGWDCKKQIFNISSGAAITPYESWAMYCSTKAGLDMMTRVISKEQNEIMEYICGIDDLCPCDAYAGDCEPAYRVKCSHCGKDVPGSIFFDGDEIDWLGCEKMIQKKKE